MANKSNSAISLLSYEDDKPRESLGTLIPRKKNPHPKHTFTPASAQSRSGNFGIGLVFSAIALLAVVLAGVTSYGLVSQGNLAAVTAASLADKQETNYGPLSDLSNDNIFRDTRSVFIEEGRTFVEVDISQKQMRFFKAGVLLQSAAVLAVGEKGSWWDVPSGLYQVEKKDKSVFTNISQVYLPWQVTFQGNFIIHGPPIAEDDSSVPEDFKVGGIKLASSDAEQLYHNLKIGTPVLVYAPDDKAVEVFTYEPEVSGITAPYYLVVDIENDTILAATDIDQSVPIASLTKLMTAVVAAEKMDLNSRVQLTSPTFVTSLIPRLSYGSSVSMYSLLQLLLVESSNEAAETIAGELGREDFMEAMNVKARQLGMLQTNFADPSGLSANNTSSLKDLYKLTKYIHENRSFIFEITGHKKIANTYVGDEFANLINFNEVEDIDSFIGGKVGETIAAGQTSISLHKINFQAKERIVLVMILGSSDRTKDVVALLDYSEERFNH